MVEKELEERTPMEPDLKDFAGLVRHLCFMMGAVDAGLNDLPVRARVNIHQSAIRIFPEFIKAYNYLTKLKNKIDMPIYKKLSKEQFKNDKNNIHKQIREKYYSETISTQVQ